MKWFRRASGLNGRRRPRLGAFLRDQRASVSPMLTLLMVPLIGVLGMATEASSWWVIQRSMQNAADSAAMAAATNGCDAGKAACVAAQTPYYNVEALAVASGAGYTNGVSSTTVTATNTATCPSGATNCYRVDIARQVPINLVRIVGFNGDSALGTGRAQTVRATSIARPRGPGTAFCMIGLGGGQAFRVNGGPNVDLSGCDVHSNGNAVCNGAGSDTGVAYGSAVGTSSCGVNELAGQPALADPFATLTSSIPAHNCAGSYPQGNAGYAINTLTASFSGTNSRCGDTRLGGNVTITTPNTILSIHNGQLNLNGHTLSTSGSGSLTIIFTGTNLSGGSTTYTHTPTGTGTINIAAPTSGPFSGVAIMQNNTLLGNRNSRNFNYSGSNPTLRIQGLIYLPNAEFEISGAINHHIGGQNCLGVIAQSILINGNGSVFDNATSDCLAAGLVLPTVPGTNSRQALVR